MFNQFWKHPFWDVFTAISTFLAVMVSLYLANREKRIIRKLNINQQFTESFDKGEIQLLVTIENLGNVPIILNNYGDGRNINENNVIMTNIQKFLDGNNDYILIPPKEAKLIIYKHNFGRAYKEGDETICNSNEYRLLSNSTFKAQDTLGNYYS